MKVFSSTFLLNIHLHVFWLIRVNQRGGRVLKSVCFHHFDHVPTYNISKRAESNLQVEKRSSTLNPRTCLDYTFN